MSADPRAGGAEGVVVTTIDVPGGSYQLVVPAGEASSFRPAIAKTRVPDDSEILELVASMLKPGDLVLDVGAGLGNHAMYLGAVTDSRVVCYEPNAVRAESIVKSAEINSCSDRVSVLPMPGAGILRLDDENHHSAIGALRVDIDGHEMGLLEGAGTLIERDHPMIHIRCRDLATFEAMSSWLFERGYEYRATSGDAKSHLFVWVDGTSIETREASAKLVQSIYQLLAENDALRSAVDPATERELRNARRAYDKVRVEALRRRDERDAANERVVALRQRLITSQKRLSKARQRRKDLDARVNELEASIGVRVEQQLRQVVRTIERFVHAVLRRVRRLASSGRSPAPRKPRPFKLAETSTVGSWLQIDPDLLVQRAAQAEAAAAKLASVDFERGHLRVAAIMDDFTRTSMEPECDLLNLTPEGWQKELEDFQPHLVFVESAWRGIEGKWHSTVATVPEELQGIFAWCRENQVPTVFWNKEDPVHFEQFVRVAAEADFVFTTDIDKLGDYALRLGHERVSLLPFGCQPAQHNPIEIGERREALCFAGSYYWRYSERMQNLRALVDAASPSMPVDIYDRNYGTIDEQVQFPDEYDRFIVGTLGPEEIEIAYKGYKYGLNLNTVKSSQSMFARRVYELLASNTVTVSNYSRAVRLLFGDLVPMSDSEDEMRDLLARLSSDRVRTDRLRALGVRKVLREHTYAHRLDYLVASVTGRQFELVRPRVTVVIEGEDLAAVKRRVAAARAQVDVEVAVHIVTDSQEVSKWAASEGLAATAGEDLAALRLADLMAPGTDGIAAFAASDWYGNHYLRDLADAWTYCDSDVVGKDHRFKATAAGIVEEAGNAYGAVTRLQLRRGLVAAGAAQRLPALTARSGDELPETLSQFAVHRFDYCQDGSSDAGASAAAAGSDLPIDQGAGLAALYAAAADLTFDDSLAQRRAVLPEALDLKVGKKTAKQVQVGHWRGQVAITSELPEGVEVQLFGQARLDVAEVWPSGVAQFGFVGEGKLDADLAVRFFSDSGSCICTVVRPPGVSHRMEVPEGAVHAELGWEVRGPGRVVVKLVHLSEWSFERPLTLPWSDRLVVTDRYPSYDDPHSNDLVHGLVSGDQVEGTPPDVFRVQERTRLAHSEFEGVGIVTGSVQYLCSVLSAGVYRTVSVHWLDQRLWESLRSVSAEVRVEVWVHDADIPPWLRASLTRLGDGASAGPDLPAVGQLQGASDRTAHRAGEHIHLVFASRRIADEVCAALEDGLPPDRYTVFDASADATAPGQD